MFVREAVVKWFCFCEYLCDVLGVEDEAFVFLCCLFGVGFV